MSRESKFFEKRRELRYEILDLESIKVQVRRGQPRETIQAELIDISPGGAKLSLRVCLRFAELVELCIKVPELKLRVDLVSEVCWVRPERDRWLIGLVLKTNIPEEALARLAKAKIIDRRSASRHSVKSQAIVRWELESEACPVEVRNYSAGGFCIASIRPGHAGALVLLEIEVKTDDSPCAIYGRVCWQIEQDGMYVLGCEIINGDGTVLFRDIRDMSEKDDRPTVSTMLTRVS